MRFGNTNINKRLKYFSLFLFYQTFISTLPKCMTEIQCQRQLLRITQADYSKIPSLCKSKTYFLREAGDVLVNI